MPVAQRDIAITSETGRQRAYFLRVDWEGRDLGSGFLLQLTDGQDAWSGEVTEATVCNEAEELEMEKERYIQDLQQALTTSSSNDDYTFTLTPPRPDSGSDVTLAYEKVQKNISFQLGAVLLRASPEPMQVVRGLLLQGLQHCGALEKQNQELLHQNQLLQQEHQHICTELRRYAEGKEHLESELYSRFILVLNEKKAKIRSLLHTVAELEEARSLKKQKKMSESEHQSNEGSEEEDAYGGSTDEEQDRSQAGPAPTSASTSTSAPTSSSVTKELGNQSPLVGNLDDLTDVAPNRKRRFRHLKPPDTEVKRTTAAKTQKHRVSPKEAGATANQEQASRGSTVPSRTGADADTEDLFEDF